MFPYDDYPKKCYNISNDKASSNLFITTKFDESSLSLGGVRLMTLSISLPVVFFCYSLMTINYKGAFRPVISRVQGTFFVKLFPMKSPNPLIRLGSRNFYYRYIHFSPLWRLSPEPPSALTGQGLRALFPAIFFR